MEPGTRGVIGGGLCGLLVGSIRQFYTHLYDNNLVDGVQRSLEDLSKRNLDSLGEMAAFVVVGAVIGYGVSRMAKYYNGSESQNEQE